MPTHAASPVRRRRVPVGLFLLLVVAGALGLWWRASPIPRALPDLFRLWGTRYGAGDGVTTFRKPDYRGRTLVGVDPVQGEFASLGQTGGAKTHTLSGGEMPAHSHGLHPWEIIMSAVGNTGYWGMGGGNASSPPTRG